jgi:translation initiation factor IF-3
LKRIHFRHRQAQRQQVQDTYPINERIRSLQVRVIDESGKILGVMPTATAIAMAREKELDLVAVSPKAEPPVAKFINYSSFKYQQEKASRKQKAQQKEVELKEIRLSPRIGKHDLDVRIKQAEKFLSRGDKISILVILKGREKAHPELARELIENFIKTINQIVEIKLEQEIKRQGSNFSAIFAQKS